MADNMRRPLLEVAILSYARVVELERCLQSFRSIVSDVCTIVVYEDCAPNRVEVENVVTKISKDLSIPVAFKSNPNNIGYDRNLLRVFESDARFVMLLSDDDSVCAYAFQRLLDYIIRFDGNVLLCPFRMNNSMYRRGRHYAGKYSVDILYDSILFSGLIFRTGTLGITSAEQHFISDCIYSQVYLVGALWEGSCDYFDQEVILVGADGENYFGKSESTAVFNELRDRKDVMSNLFYQERLQRVVFFLLDSHYPYLREQFIRNYTARLVSHYLRVRVSVSLTDYFSFLFKLRNFYLAYKRPIIFILFLIGFLPSGLCAFLVNRIIPLIRRSGG